MVNEINFGGKKNISCIEKLIIFMMVNLKLWNKWWILKLVVVGLLLLIIGFKGVFWKVWYLVLKIFLFINVFIEFSFGGFFKIFVLCLLWKGNVGFFLKFDN